AISLLEHRNDLVVVGQLALGDYDDQLVDRPAVLLLDITKLRLNPFLDCRHTFPPAATAYFIQLTDTAAAVRFLNSMTRRIVVLAPAISFIEGPSAGNRSIRAFISRPGPGMTTSSTRSDRIAFTTALPTAAAGAVAWRGMSSPSSSVVRWPWPASRIAPSTITDALTPRLR